MSEPTPAAAGDPGGRTDPGQAWCDLRRHWQRGERLRVEDYLARHPALRADPEAMLDLIIEEFSLREQRGEQTQPAEYLGRFPDLAAALNQQFALLEVTVGNPVTGPADARPGET
jgi:hypothetical protein